MNQVLSENERLLAQAIDHDIVKTVVNLSVNECQKCLELKTELLNKKDVVDKETYDKLCKSFTTLEKHCITLEADSQLNQENFQQKNSVLDQNAPSFTSFKVKMDMDEIENLNIELEHRVTKLVVENEHLKQTYKQLYDSIKPKRVQSKEQCDALIKQVNIKSGEISDLNAKLQEQGVRHSLPVSARADHSPIRQYQGMIRYSNTKLSKSSFVKFRNDQVAKIMGYGDYQIGNVTISRVYYVEGLGHNLFSVGQIWDNLYTLSLGNMMASSPICLLSKASKTKSWLWHRRLSHLNFGAINHLARHGLVRGLPKLKFEKDHLCSACALGKSSKKPHKPKSEDTNQEKLYLLHMDLCGLMRVASVNGKKYILVIVDDYSRFTWIKCLRSKDEAPAFIINFLMFAIDDPSTA
ncbi:retrovirus-related pol polyprotein from transposon TNT 1-94 [Tanacetum coccineum]